MRTTLASLGLGLLLPSTLAGIVGGCAGGSGSTGAAGQTGTGGSSTAGTNGATGGNSGTGGANAGTNGQAGTGGPAGTNGQAGSGGATGGAGGTAGSASGGHAGGSAGTGGAAAGGRGGATAGTGGQAGGAAGAGATGAGGAVAAYTCPSGPFTGITIPTGSAATRIANEPPPDTFNGGGFNFENIEGPVWIGDALYVSEFGSMTSPPPVRILKIDATDTVTTAFPSITDTGTNGLAVDGAGNLVSANHGVGGIVRFTLPGGAKTTLIGTFGGKRFNSPNDLTIRSDGTIFFTDPNFQAPSPQPQTTTGVYMLPPGGTAATAIITNLSNPNGITLSLDGRTLYVGHGGGVYMYAVNADGSIGGTAAHVDPTDLDNNATDGMAIDCAGNLYVVRVNQHDIVVVNPSNAKVGQITIPGAGQLTNCAFGGTDHKTLYVTAQGTGTQRGVFKLAMPLPGMPY